MLGTTLKADYSCNETDYLQWDGSKRLSKIAVSGVWVDWKKSDMENRGYGEE